ncbi:hypothetical protein [Helicobacter cynogastricus]|uniref:hypothetical protein n=1 Tax=Helicobacter cynogastricus TaxID=329937 RepID=UPI001F1DB1E8|nr:hypothetical protein [Helicobacter cynogastricus]
MLLTKLPAKYQVHKSQQIINDEESVQEVVQELPQNDVYNAREEFIDLKSFNALEGVPSINEWVRGFSKIKEGWGYVEQGRGDVQHTSYINLSNTAPKIYTRPLYQRH